MNGPILPGGALGQQDVLEGVDQVDVTRRAQGGAAVIE